MKLKIKSVLDSNRALTTLSNTEVPLSTAIKLAKNLRALSEAVDLYEQRHKKLLDRLGKPTANNQQFLIPPAKVDEYNGAHDKMLAEEVDLDVTQIMLADLGDISVSPNNLVPLDWMIADMEHPLAGRNIAEAG